MVTDPELVERGVEGRRGNYNFDGLAARPETYIYHLPSAPLRRDQINISHQSPIPIPQQETQRVLIQYPRTSWPPNSALPREYRTHHPQMREEFALTDNTRRPNSLRLGSVAPNFDADTSNGPINFHDFIGDSWVVLFSHPVCEDLSGGCSAGRRLGHLD
jgi:hypothetical protein